MSMTVERRTKSTVRTEYSASLSAKRENRPRLIIGAPRDSAAPFKTVRREIISGQSNTARFAGKKTGTLWRALALRSGETRVVILPATLRHYAEMTSRSAAVAHALLRAASSLTRRLGALEQRASAKGPTRHARERAPRQPVIQCEVVLASGLRANLLVRIYWCAALLPPVLLLPLLAMAQQAPAGTRISIRLKSAVSTRSSKPADSSA